MLSKLLIASLLAGLAVAPSAAATRTLMPGVTYDRQVQFTSHGPVVIDVLTGPRPGGLWGLKPVLSNESILDTEKLTAIQRRLSPTATVAGISGDLFSAVDGHPSGLLLRNGGLDHQPLRDRSSLGIDAAGGFRVERIALIATWQGSGQRRAITELNEPPEVNGVALFTPAWGSATPALTGTSVGVVLSPFPPVPPNGQPSGPVAQVVQNAQAPIPPDGAVLVARGTAAVKLAAEAQPGGNVTLRPVLKPDWSGVVDAIGGGPVLVKNGRAIFRANEAFATDQLLPRASRAAAGQLKDGRILLVTVEGGLPGYSTGMTNFELALTMLRLHAVTAMALGSGSSTSMAFEGQPLTAPPDAVGERPIADALLLTYSGVYAPAPLEAVLSPNGDGVAEKQQLAYKVVRPSTVAVNLLGPDNVARYAFTGQVTPGTYPLDWAGTRSDGSPEAEGRWRWVVTATDDLGRASAIERRFSLNETLGFPRPVAGTLTVPRPVPRAVATFTLTRAAAVTATIQTPAGVVLRTFPRTQAQPGQFPVGWDGVTDTGGVVFTGRYVARASATNELGTVELASDFAVRRVAGQG